VAYETRSLLRTERIWCLGAEDLDLRIPFFKALCAFGFHVEAVGTGDPSPFDAAGIPFHSYELTRTLAPWSDSCALLKLVQLARRHRPQILHGFDTKPSLLAPLTVALVREGRAVRTINGLGRIFGSSSGASSSLRLAYCGMQKLVAPFTAMTVFQNNHDCEYFERHGLVGNGGATIIRGSGVDIDAINSVLANREAVDALRQKLDLGNKLVVTCVSRLTRQKGIPVLLQAAARIARYRNGVVFLVVGSNEGEGTQAVPPIDIERHAPYVRALGARRDVPAILAISHVFVLPTQYAEGIPRSLLEAGAAGLPLVTTRVPGCSDIVRDKWNGVLVEPGDASGLAAQIDRLLDAPDLRRRMGVRARQTVHEGFSLREVTTSYADVYRQLLGH
jgi:glycosyltransferase involved in cell wall biosynthesis